MARQNDPACGNEVLDRIRNVIPRSEGRFRDRVAKTLAKTAGIHPVPNDDATAILARLHEPGRTLLFCDDTDIPRASIENFARDIRVLCATVMPSETYSTLVTQMEKRLTELGQTEFHATEIANPKSTSSWSKVPVAERLGALRLLRDLLSDASMRARYVHVSKSQFEELRKAAEELGEDLGVGHRAGLKRVFLRSILERLEELGDNPILVIDQNKSLDQAQIEHIAGGGHLFGGGPVVAISKAVAGLQLADMAAYSIGRFLRKRRSIEEGTHTPVDTIAAEVVGGFAGCIEHLLRSPTQSAGIRYGA